MKENDTFFKEGAGQFKNQALAAGHKQLGGHQIFDSKLGFHRMATLTEANNTMQAEMRKRGSKVGYQYHSMGIVNTDNGILEKDVVIHMRVWFQQRIFYPQLLPTQLPYLS
jgi:hypothetical protein